jgi:hypothetical protein
LPRELSHLSRESVDLVLLTVVLAPLSVDLVLLAPCVGVLAL